MAEIREEVVEAIVAWKLANKGPRNDPHGTHYDLLDGATPEELFEALKRWKERMGLRCSPVII